jgi:hypothetical protein
MDIQYSSVQPRVIYIPQKISGSSNNESEGKQFFLIHISWNKMLSNAYFTQTHETDWAWIAKSVQWLGYGLDSWCLIQHARTFLFGITFKEIVGPTEPSTKRLMRDIS